MTCWKMQLSLIFLYSRHIFIYTVQLVVLFPCFCPAFVLLLFTVDYIDKCVENAIQSKPLISSSGTQY